jgi:hypothetical protein
METQARILQTPITLHWVQRTGGTFDGVTKEITGGSITENQVLLRGFVHYLKPGDFRIHHYAELEVNDVLVNFPAAAEIDGKDQMRFEIAGKDYVVKPNARSAPQTWGSLFSGVKIGRIVILKLKP